MAVTTEYLSGGRIQGTEIDRAGISKAGCLGFWKFQEQTGDVINIATTGNGFADGLGSAADGDVDAGMTRDATGKFRTYAYSWADAGTIDVSVPDQSGLDITGDITVTCWIYPTETGATNGRVFLAKRSASNSTNYQFFLQGDSNSQLSYHDNTNSTITLGGTNANVSIDTWHFVAFTIASNTISIYLDNVLLGTQASLSSRPTNSAPVSFGQANYSTAEEYAGRIQDCTIWNRALTADELSALWNSSSGAKLEDLTGISDVPVGTRYEETDTRKIFRYAQDLVSGADLKAYYKFDESSGNIENEADQVTGDDTNGADLVVNNGGTPSHIDYQGATGTPSGLPNVASWERTSVTDGAFADANGASSLWNFLHYGDGNTNIKSTICFWAKFSDVETNTMLITTTGNSRDQTTDIGLFLKFYADKFYIYINVGDAGGTNNESALQASTSTSYLVQDGTWHFYSLTFDWALGSANCKVKRDNANAESFNKTNHSPVSGNAKTPLCFGHVTPSTESMIPPDYAVADFSLWARVLTDAEITKIYNSGKGMDLVTGTNLWKEKGTA